MSHTFKASLFAALVASTGLVGLAHAQTTTTPGTTGTTAPATPMPGATVAPSSPAVTAPTMGTPPAANTRAAAPHGNTTHSNSAAPAAVNTTGAASRTSAAPVAGANSFTEGEARRRIQAKGFGQVTDLKKDDKGVWRGMSTKDGKPMSVALDYQGNVVSQ